MTCVSHKYLVRDMTPYMCGKASSMGELAELRERSDSLNQRPAASNDRMLGRTKHGSRLSPGQLIPPDPPLCGRFFANRAPSTAAPTP